MIIEFIKSLTEKAIPSAKTFGHVYESVAIQKRHERCLTHWKDHINHCQHEILNFINSCPNKNSILILGSGPLHEIPLDDILKLASHVVLVDAIHPKEVLKKYRDNPCVEFIFHDISELENDLINGKVQNKVPQLFLDNNNFDIVISANLLSQIPYHIKKYLEKKFKHLSENQIDQYCIQVAKDHINYLNSFNANILLITDVETNIIYPQQNLIEVETPYHEKLFQKFNREWIWELSPIGEKSWDYHLQMKVVSIILKRI